MFKFSVGDVIVVKEGYKKHLKSCFYNPSSVYKTLVITSLTINSIGNTCYCFEDCKSWLFKHEIEKMKKGQIPLPFKGMK